MTVLAEEGIKSSVSSSSLPSSTYFIPDERFAAAAIGGRVDVIGGDSATTSSAPMKRKTAHLVCQCCFVEYEFHSMVSCRYGGHLFCMECLRKHTEQRVFGNGNFGKVCAIAAGQKQLEQGPDDQRESNGNENALELLCMASDCVSGFDDRVLSKALPKKVLDRYDELRFKANIERANMPDVSTCPKCDFTAVVAIHRDPRKHLLFNCPKCHFKSCRLCHEEYHPNIPRCDLVESKIETSGRNKVEEAMTSALIRCCPRISCRKKLLKSGGCNKLKCACGCLICNVCRVEIPATVGYDHFCRTPHCNHAKCGICPLFADTTASDAKRIANAAKKAAESVLKAEGVSVDVASIMQGPPPMKRQC